MSIVLCILILVMGVIVHKIYASCVTVIHFGFQIGRASCRERV